MKFYSRRIDTKVVRNVVQVKVTTYRRSDNEFVSQITWELPLAENENISCEASNDDAAVVTQEKEDADNEQDSNGE